MTHAISANSASTTRGVVRWFIRETIGTIMAGVILFLCAGRWDWLWGWVTVGTVAYYVGGTAFVLLPQNPALLAERTGPKKGAKKWDTLIMSLVGTIILAIYIVGGLDVRYGWTSNFPTWAQIIGVALTLLGYTLVLWAVAANTFFSLIVRIQKERRHSVATGGPYRFVRHPGYVGTILAYVGTPMLLGSLWALGLGILTLILMIGRTAVEDKMLLEELDGYKDYAVRVQFRLLPGVW